MNNIINPLTGTKVSNEWITKHVFPNNGKSDRLENSMKTNNWEKKNTKRKETKKRAIRNERQLETYRKAELYGNWKHYLKVLRRLLFLRGRGITDILRSCTTPGRLCLCWQYRCRWRRRFSTSRSFQWPQQFLHFSHSVWLGRTRTGQSRCESNQS